MEVDERLRWLEARVSSSLKPRGEDLRNLFADEGNRSAFLAFCNHSESRRLFVYLSDGRGQEMGSGDGSIHVTTQPPSHLSDKALVFLKCSHASKLSRESIAEDVVYSECSQLPLQHMELVMREVYLPLIGSHDVSADKLLDLMHRLLALTQVTRGHTEGEVVLPLPSIDALAEAAAISSSRPTVIHILESSVVAWMKQVKMALHLDPSTVILRSHGKYAGPLAEVEFWSERLHRLESVRDQLISVVVQNILHNLEQVHSTYAQAFSHVHGDVCKAIVDTELYLVYLSALKPWLLRLHQAFSPDSLIQTFPPLLACVLLIWQHSGLYSTPPAFLRLLRLLSNEVMLKARDVVGEDLLTRPEESLVNLKLALRVCAAFRGCYLDYREKAEALLQAHSEEQTTADTRTSPAPSFPRGVLPCSWPPRNSPVFASLNTFMERANDLLELVQTVHDFRELEVAIRGDEEGEPSQTVVRGDPLIGDLHSEFTASMSTFTQDLLTLEPEGQFEETFFEFRSTIRSLEQRLVGVLQLWFDLCPTVLAELRVLEMFQGLLRREAVQDSLKEHCEGIVSNLIGDIQDVSNHLATDASHPLPHINAPPTASKLLWLHSLRQRVSEPMERLKVVAPYLLEGDLGWRLRQEYSDLFRNIDSHAAETESSWVQSIPLGLNKSLVECVLTQTPDGLPIVNFDPGLRELLRESHYLSRQPLHVRLPTAVRQLLRSVDLDDLGQRYTNLEATVHTYRQIIHGMSEVDKMLFHNKLQLVDSLLSQGLGPIHWQCTDFPDFVAKSKALIQGDLLCAVSRFHSHTEAVKRLTDSWSQVPGLDMFAEGREGTLAELEKRHTCIVESMEHGLPLSVGKITAHVHQAFECVESSQESPAWEAYLNLIDQLVIQGLKAMVLTAIGTLTLRAQMYEKGDPIPPLLTVGLELQSGDINFSPPLSPHSPTRTVPETVARWMDKFTSLTKIVRRFASGCSESCYLAIVSDSDICSAFSKISAHLETNARQCQSLRKRFSIYSFLWEQDVQNTFAAFLQGQAPPHPRRFTRPETIRSRASARLDSGRPRSSAQSQTVTPAPPETTLLGVMGVSDWDFLCPPGHTPSLEEDVSKRPSLDDFDGEIAIFQGILDRLSNIEDIVSVGWLSVDQRPSKQAMSSLTAKWKYVYANYLEQRVLHVLASLQQFFSEIEPKVEESTGEEEDTQAFLRLMSVFNNVTAKQVEMDTKFGAVHRAVLILEKFGHPLPHTASELFASVPQRWSNLKKRVALGKQRTGPRIQANEQTISQDITAFGGRFHHLSHQFHASSCLEHGCPDDEFRTLITSFVTELKELQQVASDLIELQELLETNIFNFSLLNEFDQQLVGLQELRGTSDMIQSEHAQWKKLVWLQVECADVLVMTERQLQAVCCLSECVRLWEIYTHTLRNIVTIQTTAPLVEGLKSPAMRPRHWKQVLRYASAGHTMLLGRGGVFDPALLEEMTFGQLLDLELHCHRDEVLAIVKRANKDVSIESLLNTFEEVWLSRQLELSPYQRTGLSHQDTLPGLELEGEMSGDTPKPRAPSARITSAVRRAASVAGRAVSRISGSPVPQEPTVMLLCNTTGIFETLESHQMSLQTLMGTVAAVSFSDDLNKWHKQLQTIEAVLRIWLQVQELWLQLEEVYSSSDVRQHLSTASYTFTTVDTEWKDLMKATSRNPSVTTVCLREGLLLSVEKLQSSLQECQSALVQHMESQRLRCPWFYFLPLKDVLNFVCYGSNPNQLSVQISKLLPSASGLTYDDSLGGATQRRGRQELTKITAVVSRMGESLELMEPVKCEGPVDAVLVDLLNSLSATLQYQLTTIVVKHVFQGDATQQPTLSNLPVIWETSCATQVTILSTQLALELCTARAVEEVSSTHTKAPLQSVNQEICNLVSVASQVLRGKSSVSKAIPEVSSGVPNGDSQVCIDSDTALKASASNVCGVESALSSELLIPDLQMVLQPMESSDGVLSRDQTNKLQSTLLTLSTYSQTIAQLCNNQSNGPNLFESFSWQSMLHYSWQSDDQRCILSTLGASTIYGYHYCGSWARLVLTPATERVLTYLLKAVQDRSNPLLLGPPGCGKSSLVSELAANAGQPLFSLHCSPETTNSTVVDFLKGMAGTGSWLHLHNLDCLCLGVLQTVCNLLSCIMQSKNDKSASFQWEDSTTVHVSLDSPCACVATVHATATFPRTILQSFKTCRVQHPEQKQFLEALLLAYEFESSVHLAKTLTAFISAFNQTIGHTTTAENMKQLHGLQIRHLTIVVSLAQQHMKELESVTQTALQQQGALHVPSGVYSDFSAGTRSSLYFKPTFLHTERGKVVAPPRSSLEEFALVLSLKDNLLPSFPPGSSGRSTLVQLLVDTFPSCDVPGLLAHEQAVRESLFAKAASDSQAVESARESRAASAMQVVVEEYPSGVSNTFEEHLIHCCHLHSLQPTPRFQVAVTQLLSLLHSHPIVAVSGPSCSGKTAAIQVALEATRELLGGVTCTTIAPNALPEGELMGYSSGVYRDGLLPTLLGGQLETERVKSASKWIILEGKLCSSQMDRLLSLLQPHPHLQLANGGTVTLSPAHHLILEVPDLTCLSPSCIAKIATLCVGPGTVSWRDVLHQWLLKRKDHQKERLQSLFGSFVPKCIEFLGPLLAAAAHEEVGSDVSVVQASSSSELGPRLAKQKLMKLTEVHIITTCCSILERLLSESPSSTEMDLCFIYSVVWAFGGFLTPENKIIFDGWWRKTFADDLCPQFPDSGLLWDFYVKAGCPLLMSWKESIPHHSAINVDMVPYVPTVQSMAVQHLVRMLIDKGYPVLINGPMGSGKTSLLLDLLKTYCVPGVTDASLLHITSSGCTGPGVVWAQLEECLEWRWGRRYSPSRSKKLVCFIDDLHTTQGPESSVQASVCELVRGHLATGGLYVSSSGKWHSVSDVSYIGTVCVTTSCQLSPQFLKHFAVIHWDGFNSDALVHIFGTMLRSYFSPPSESPTTQVVDSVVQMAVQLHEKLEKMFIPTPERAHYLFTLRQIAAVFRRLCHSLKPDCTSHDLLLLWKHESWWAYAGAMSSEVDRDRYSEAVSHVLRKFLLNNEELPVLLSDQPWLLPLRTAADVGSKVSQMMDEYNSANPTLHINLYGPTLTEMHRLSTHLSMPHGLSHTLLLGHSHPEPLVQLAALLAGFTVMQVSFCFSPGLLASCDPQGMSPRSYRDQEFQRDLVTVYTRAGVKDEKLVLLVTGSELLHVTFLTRLYEFVKGGAITHLFSPEERSRIISAVRSDLTQLGKVFTMTAAWQFFLRRVCRNLHVVVALPAVSDVVQCAEWREMVNCMNVYCHLSWDRKQLVAVAMHHVQDLGLPETQCQSVAHLLASVHLALEARKDIPTTSTFKYEYFVERITHEYHSAASSSSEHCSALSSALQCVSTAEEKVGSFQLKLEREKVVLGEKQEACQKLLAQIGQDSAISRERNKLVVKQQARIDHLQHVIPDYERACELTVEEKERLIVKLEQEVVTMDQESLMELRALQKPPQEIEELLSAVIMIIKSPSADISWTKGSKRLMANLDRFRELLQECSKNEERSETILESLEPLLGKPCLSQEQVARHPGGTAAAQLCSWVHGIVRLHTMLQTKLRPLETRLFSMNTSLTEYREKLKSQEAKLQVLYDRLAGLSQSLETASVEKSQQEELVNNMTRELSKTQEFLNILGRIPEHWKQQLSVSKSMVADTLGGLVLTVALSVYLGAVPHNTQLEVINRDLRAVLEERGVPIQWKAPSSLLQQFSTQLLAQTLDEDEETEPQHLTSYYHLCTNALPHLVPESLTDQWLLAGLSLPNLLPMAMVTSQWNRWPLIHDPNGAASTWIRQTKGEQLVILSAMDRSARFFLSLETALLSGQSVLIENVTREMDPALLPLDELGQTWNQKLKGPKVVKLCGRRLHVHPSFHLYMTTTCNPGTLPSFLTAGLDVVDFRLSFPLTQELLLDMTFDQLQEYHDTCACVAACKRKLSQTNTQLLQLLGKECSQSQGGLCNIGEVENLVNANAQWTDEMSSHMNRLAELMANRAQLLPIARHGALIYEFLQRLATLSPLAHTSWILFADMFTAALKEHHDLLQKLRQPDSKYGVLRAVLKTLNSSLLQAMHSALNHNSWILLASAILVLTHCNLLSDPSATTDQLCYISQGDSYLQRLELSDSLPPLPAGVSEELWSALHRAPLSTAYFSEVIQSIDSSPEFWQGLQTQGWVDVAKFPWRRNDSQLTTLDDLTFLRCLNEKEASESLQQEVSMLTETISIPLLSEVCLTAKCGPIMFLHDEESLVSQANLLQLERDLRKALQDKVLHVVRFGSSLEETVSELLQPTTDYLLISDIHGASPEWLERLFWKIRQATTASCVVMLTASARGLPNSEYLQTAHKVVLSKVASSLSKGLPQEVWLDDASSFLSRLQFTLANIPESMLTGLPALQEFVPHIIFLLAVLHTTLVSTCSPAPYFTELLTAILHLVSTARACPNPDLVLVSIQSAVGDIYSHCRPTAEVERATNCCLTREALSSAVPVVPRDGVEVVLPSANVPPRLYQEHVAGLRQESTTGTVCRWEHLTSAIDHLLVPVIMDMLDMPAGRVQS